MQWWVTPDVRAPVLLVIVTCSKRSFLGALFLAKLLSTSLSLFIGPFSYWIFAALCARLALQSARACYHLTSVGRLALKSCGDGVVNLFQPDELQLIARVFRDVFVIPPVAGR
jgi:hypothetical protein